jgi:hypothetical protein
MPKFWTVLHVFIVDVLLDMSVLDHVMRIVLITLEYLFSMKDLRGGRVVRKGIHFEKTF